MPQNLSQNGGWMQLRKKLIKCAIREMHRTAKWLDWGTQMQIPTGQCKHNWNKYTLVRQYHKSQWTLCTWDHCVTRLIVGAYTCLGGTWWKGSNLVSSPTHRLNDENPVKYCHVITCNHPGAWEEVNPSVEAESKEGRDGGGRGGEQQDQQAHQGQVRGGQGQGWSEVGFLSSRVSSQLSTYHH